MKYAVLLIPLLFASAFAPNARAEAFDACLNELRGKAGATGISAHTFDTAMAGVEADQSVLDAMAAQPEFKLPVWDYLAGLVDDRRIADGRKKLAQWADVLDAVEREFGVDRHVIVAVWGVESDYGNNVGGRPLVRSLATVSCFGGRQAFFRRELFETLRILQSGDIPPRELVGSWAGAFGQTQFMPSTFQRLAVDFDGDGRRDIVGSVPDALASTANYLKRAGWKTGEPWGYEVDLPAGYDGPSGRRHRAPLAEWRERGILRIDGKPLTGDGPGALVLPAGTAGPAFIVFANFNAIYSYNSAVTYALAIAHLADRLAGGGPFKTPWPTDDAGLSRAERVEVQKRLLQRGFDIGEADGIIGSRTRAAIEAFQQSAGLPANGRAGQRVLKALRAANPAQ